MHIAENKTSFLFEKYLLDIFVTFIISFELGIISRFHICTFYDICRGSVVLKSVIHYCTSQKSKSKHSSSSDSSDSSSSSSSSDENTFKIPNADLLVFLNLFVTISLLLRSYCHIAFLLSQNARTTVIQMIERYPANVDDLKGAFFGIF